MLLDFLSAILLGCVLPLSAHSKTVVNDITNINPIEVRSVITAKSVSDITEAVKKHAGPISIGGGRYSMGGQTATENAVQIDMRQINKVLLLDVAAKKLTVQAGIRWRDIQEHIDPHGLSVKIMQTYSNFTVGGSLSVNVHGRYLGEGPVIRSVESFKIVLASGEEVTASREVNPDIFFSAIGGYGGIGVITEVTLNLVTNEKIRREVNEMPIGQYKKYFLSKIRSNPDAILHNGNIFPTDYQTVKAETWYRTTKPLTVKDKLIPKNQSYWLAPNAISSLSTLPYGKEFRARVIEPLFNKKETVVWRNYEASYDVAQLEPMTPRLLYTYVLQEYFIPVEKFDEFIPKMRAIFQKHGVNVLNVSIRHALPDNGNYLAWAPTEVFSFIVYYKQGTADSAKLKVAQWTRELIDQAIALGGRYYLPYQIHATNEQFKKAYPNSEKFFEAKKKYDPTNKFRNKLWDKYYQPGGA